MGLNYYITLGNRRRGPWPRRRDAGQSVPGHHDSLGDDQTDLCVRYYRVTHTRGTAQCNDSLDHLIVDSGLDQGAGARDAGLSGSGEDARDDAVDRSVLEDDVR